MLLAAPMPGAWAQRQFEDRWHAGDAAPDVEGVHLGDTRAQVIATLGEPEPSPLPEDPNADLIGLRYRHGGLLVALTRSGGVVRILLRKPEGGAIAGIHVGDRIGAMLKGWGEPTQSRRAIGRYEMGDWSIRVHVDFADQKILKLMLASASPLRTAPPPPPVDMP